MPDSAIKMSLGRTKLPIRFQIQDCVILVESSSPTRGVDGIAGNEGRGSLDLSTAFKSASRTVFISLLRQISQECTVTHKI